MDIIEVEIYDYTDSVDVEITENNTLVEVTIGEGITHVKTDGITIIGDGITTELSAVVPSSSLSAIEWDSNHSTSLGNEYLIDDLVFYNGHIYKAKFNNDGIIPTNSVYWTDLGEGYRLQENLVDYSDVLNTPTIPTAVSQLDNDLGFFTGDDISLVATTGSYLDLLDLPTIPSSTSQLTNDGADGVNPFITSADITTPTLESVLSESNTTNGNDISISDGDSIILDNGARLKKGTTDNYTGGAKGIALRCSVDYELKWEAGRLFVLEQDGFTIREVSHNFTITPSVYDDNTKGYIVGSKWILDNGDTYNCSDNTTGSAVWELYKVIPINTSDLINDGEDGVNPYITLNDIPSLTGYVPYTGATTNVDLGEYQIKVGQIELDQSPTGTAGVGITRWNNTIGSIETTLKGGNVILKNGVDLVARIVNKVTPNTTLTKATYPVVRVSGASGQRLGIAYAQANNDNNSADTLGVVIETIPTNQEGFILTVGQIEDINTTGSLQGETWADGDVLYLSPTTPGAVTNIKPNGSNGHIVVIGYVEYAHAIHGKIYVKVMNGWEVSELHDCYINGVTDGQVLTYESSTSLWKNKQTNILELQVFS